MKKSAFLLLLMMVFVYGIATAHDCTLFTETSLQSIEGTLFKNTVKENPVIKTITEEGLHRALINLKTHCCLSKTLNNNQKMLDSCENDKNLLNERTNYPASRFLFDHLIDVMMRRLTIDNRYEEVPLDDAAKERRKSLDDIFNRAEGAIPPEISKNYQKNRGLQSEYQLPEYNGVSRHEYVRVIENSEKLTPKYAKYNERNLATKYRNTCQTAIYLIGILPVHFDSNQLLLAQKACNKMMEESLNQEAEYLHGIIKYKSDNLLAETMNEYSNKYLMGTRAENFEDKLTRMVTNLLGIERMIPRIIPICN